MIGFLCFWYNRTDLVVTITIFVLLVPIKQPIKLKLSVFWLFNPKGMLPFKGTLPIVVLCSSKHHSDAKYKGFLLINPISDGHGSIWPGHHLFVWNFHISRAGLTKFGDFVSLITWLVPVKPFLKLIFQNYLENRKLKLFGVLKHVEKIETFS